MSPGSPGTIPQLSHRRCSLRFKGWPLDQWLHRNLTGQPHEHVIGYTAEETPRAARDLVYATNTRSPRHPLIEWGWTRAACLARLHTEFGITWEKSACTFCPYAGGKSLTATLTRMRRHPTEAATALLLEAPAIALNPNSRLFGAHSLRDRLLADGNTTAIRLADQQLHERAWSVYRVRRLHFPAAGDPSRKGTSWRSITVLHTGDHASAHAWLRQAALEARCGLDADGRLWHRRAADPPTYPAAEEFLVATTAGIEPKAPTELRVPLAARVQPKVPVRDLKQQACDLAAASR
jgi:hypothetical protein